MSVFDNRTLNEEEKRNLKIAVEDTVEAMRQIDDLNNHIKENNKGICDSLNENVSVPEQKIKPSMIKKMAKARLKEEYLAKAKDELNETEFSVPFMGKEAFRRVWRWNGRMRMEAGKQKK